MTNVQRRVLRWVLKRAFRNTHIPFTILRDIYKEIRITWETEFYEDGGLAVDYDLRKTFELTQTNPLTYEQQISKHSFTGEIS